MRLEQLKPARFDESMREQMEQDALDAFLEDRVKRVLAGEADSSSQFITILSHERTPTPRLKGCFVAIPLSAILALTVSSGWHLAHNRFIARSVGCFVPTACLSFAFA